MAENDWYEAGEQIKKIVQDAVDSKDFSQLGNTVAGIVNDAMSGLQSAIRDNLGQKQGAAQGTADGRDGSARRYEYTNREAAERIRRNIEKRRQQEKSRPVRTVQRVSGEYSAKALKWCGYIMTAVFGAVLVLVLPVLLMTHEPVAVPAGIMAILMALGVGISLSGRRRLDMAKRFRRYQEILGTRTHCLIEELAAGIGRSKKFVRRDLQRMLRRGYFAEGYLDRGMETLITDQATYQQYLATQAEYDRRASEAARQQEGPDGKADMRKLPPECREIIAEGQQYIQHIHECNEKIAGADMSARLDRLELVITRIFRELEKNPDTAGDLRKMMGYYLPTTQKLLDAYCEMDAQPVRGQNISNTQKEIESALDTINGAFENLLDSFFQERAWDISSDISVLNTMLAQEGLTGKDFKLQGGKKNE